MSVAAGRLSVNPDWRLAEFHQRLVEERRRLDELSIGDLDVRASIGLSYQALDSRSRKLLRRLGLVNAPDWPGWVADAAADTRAGATHPLDRLTDLHLVESIGRDAVGQQRFRLHDLVVDFARERALTEDRPQDRADALGTMLSGWLALAADADDLVPHDLSRPPRVAATAPSDRAVRTVRSAPADWFEAERHSLTAAVDQACQLGMSETAGWLALRFSGFLWLHSYHHEWEETLRRALSSACDSHLDFLRLRLLSALFEVCLRRHRYPESADIAAEAVTVARELADPEWEVQALRHRGQAAVRLGRLTEAAGWLGEATQAARHHDIPSEVLRDCLGSLGWASSESGQTERAVPLFEEALDIGRDKGNSQSVALCLYHYGIALTDLGRLDEAAQAFTDSLKTAREVGDDLGVAYLEQAIADVDIRSGWWPQAAERLDRARSSHERLGDSDGLAETLRSLGDLAAATDRWPDAVRSLRQALDIWRRVDDKVQVARTLARLERALTSVGDNESALASACEYRMILANLGLAEACLRMAVGTVGYRTPRGRN